MMEQLHVRFRKEQDPLCVIGGEEGNWENPLMDLSEIPFFIDGGQIADNLQGVIFKCVLDPDGKGVTVSLNDPENESYFNQFNQEYVFGMIVDQVLLRDAVSSTENNDAPESDVRIYMRKEYPHLFADCLSTEKTKSRPMR